MEVFIDVVIIQNFLINYILLLLTKKLLKFRVRKRNIIFSSILGSIYTIFLFGKISILVSIPIKIIIGFLIVAICFIKYNFSDYIKACLIFFLLSFLLGGMCLLIITLNHNLPLDSTLYLNQYSIKYTFIMLGILYIIVSRIESYLKERSLIKNFTYDIYIKKDKEIIILKGFLDTGNELREPITNLPCIIIENKYLNNIHIDENEKYIINYKTISSNSKISGFISKTVMIKNCSENNWYNVEAVICGCDINLNKNNEFQALISRGVL